MVDIKLEDADDFEESGYATRRPGRLREVRLSILNLDAVCYEGYIRYILLSLKGFEDLQ